MTKIDEELERQDSLEKEGFSPGIRFNRKTLPGTFTALDIDRIGNKKLPDISEAFHSPKALSPRSPLSPRPGQKTKVSDYFDKFIKKIRGFPDVYDLFVEEAQSHNILHRKPQHTSEYYYKHIHDKQAVRTRARSIPRNMSGEKSSELIVNNSISPLRSTRNKQNLNLNDFLKKQEQKEVRFTKRQDDDTKSMMSAQSRFTIVGGRRARVRTIGTFDLSSKAKLDRQKPKFIKIFRQIAQNETRSLKKLRITHGKLQRYLQQRYPEKMVDTMMRYLDLSDPIKIDVYAEMMEIFITSDNLRQLYFWFDVFDLNHDGYIWYHDAYTAMQISKESCYDSDIGRLYTLFTAKKQRKLAPQHPHYQKRFNIREDLQRFAAQRDGDQSNRRQSYTSSGHRKQLNYYNQEKPEALTFEDFARVEFRGGKPEMFADFITYLTGHDVYELLNLREAAISPDRRRSEDFVADVQMGVIHNFYQLGDEVDQRYLKELQTAMELFSEEKLKILLEKFAILQCQEITTQGIITKKSFIKNWHKLFSVRNDLIAERVYNLLSTPANLDVTKPRFLREMLNWNKTMDKKRNVLFAFNIYDLNGNGTIEAWEISDLLQTLIPQTPVYDEVMILVDDFVDSYLRSGSGQRQKMDKMPLNHFQHLMNDSMLPAEIFNSFFSKSNFNQAFNLVRPVTPKTREKQQRNSKIFADFK